MKVLFAVSKEDISESIVKKYQRDYKEIISYKNVYYFNAIIKELQKDKTYDRIVILEDLEEFAQSQYDQIDKFIFDKLDSISDEAANSKGDDIPIILICSDRRQKSDEMLIKLFGIGIYNALLGNDRSIDTVCTLLNKPRTKKEAKSYYRIDSDDVTYQSENENDVSEMEMQNILSHYKRLGKDEKKYVQSFNNIAAQYNDTQLRIISKYLPLNVRAVLEEQSPKYQQIMSFNNKVSDDLRQSKPRTENLSGTSEKLLTVNERREVSSSPIVIPSSVNLNSTKKMGKTKNPLVDLMSEFDDEDESEEIVGSINHVEEIDSNEDIEEAPKRRRGRPRKIVDPSEVINQGPKRGRGRPRKQPLEEINNTNVDFEDEEKDDFILPGLQQEESPMLPGFDRRQEIETESSVILPGLEEKEPIRNNTVNYNTDTFNSYNEISRDPVQNTQSIQHNQYVQDVDITHLLTSDKKIACFIGTSKNGTSFIINNLAQICSEIGIDTAILDVTKNKNAYYIYTKNEEALRRKAANTPNNLLQGIADGISINRNLTVYTTVPSNEEDRLNNAGKVLETLVKRHTLILIDTDFDTPLQYFEKAQEVYLIQSYDILTIQPLTEFLKKLKYKNIINDNKLRIILNKTVRNRNIGSKKMEELIIGGMSKYNDPNMSVMTDLFDERNIKYIAIPFDQDIYSRYLQGIIDCDISIKNYSKDFMQILNELRNMVYPLVSGKSAYRPPAVEARGFSPSMNSTLEQMKRKY